MAASMALQVLVSPLVETVLANLGSLIQSEFALLSGFKQALEKFSSTLSTIKDVIEDAELKQLKNKPLQNWLNKLKDAAYDAEDILDELATEALTIQTMEIQTSDKVKVLHLSSCINFKQVYSRRAIAERMRKVQRKFDEIARERSDFHLEMGNRVESRSTQHLETSSVIAEKEVYGREDDKDYMVNLLIKNTGVEEEGGDHSRAGDASVCVIHGMGGLGKTTLAKMVYHDGRIVNHFQVRCWVCVSDNFDPKFLLRATIESLGGVANDLENLEPLQRRLREKLNGQRFLVVLDDVWNDDMNKWDVLKSSFRCGSKDSSIIVTTRLEKVASIMSTLPVCRPKGLSHEDCFSLFKHRAFDMGKNEIEIYPKLEAIGKEIALKCGGIPLAAKALGALLRCKREEKEWLFVRDNEIWELQLENEDTIFSILRLSYNHLPSHLRLCFAYCSVFPKDYEFNRQELIYLWMANGFVPFKGSHLELEDVGIEIFNDLLWGSFFQASYNDISGNVISYKMHDLMHDLACSIMREECSVIENDKTRNNTGNRRLRHVSFHPQFSSSLQSYLVLFVERSKPNLRTLLCECFRNGTHLQLNFKNLRNLRTLNLSWINTKLDRISNLKHLRYLNLSNTGITSLPNKSFCQLRNLQTLNLPGCLELQMLPKDLSKLRSLRHLFISGCSALTSMPDGMGKLINLQTLDLSYCKKLQMLPNDLSKLRSLRHLCISGCDALTRMPDGMGELVNLQTLSFFIVGAESGSTIEQLQGLNNLKGKLTIKAMNNVRNVVDAKKANLMGKHNLRVVHLEWSPPISLEQGNSYSTSEQQEEVLEIVAESLKHLPNLSDLSINGYGGAMFPSGLSCISNLVNIELFDCQRVEHLPALGLLPVLNILKLCKMDSVRYIRDEFYHGNHVGQSGFVFFPSLEVLSISEMPSLEEWSSPSSEVENGIKEDRQTSFPHLTNLTISKCTKLRKIPLSQLSLRVLKLRNCVESFLVSCLESLSIFKKIDKLHIAQVYDLISFGVSGTTMMMTLQNLTSLEIISCDKLKNLTKELYNNLTSLTGLIIGYCPEFEFTTDEFYNLPVLGSLYLFHLPKVTSLPGWIANLTTLDTLTIEDCYNLKYLPSEPLTSLNNLMIENCHPDLHRRCDRDKGTDWYKIAHIPNLYL